MTTPSESQRLIIPPTESGSDNAYHATRIIVSAIPGAGPAINEFLGGVGSPLERRRLQWEKEVSCVLNRLESQFHITPGQALHNEAFVSFAVQASMAAVKTHQQEKLNALRNALLASGGPQAPSEDVMFQFLRYVEELTPSHLKIMTVIDQLGRCDALEDIYVAVGKRGIKMPDRAFFRACVEDLAARYLLNLGDVTELPEFEKGYQALVDDSEPKPLWVTSLGRQFLEFIGHTSVSDQSPSV